MTDSAEKPAKDVQSPPGVPFKPGYDQRRWLKGAPRKPKNKKRAEELLEHLIWEVLSEELEHPVTKEKVDRFRAMIRSMTTSKQSADRQAILDRIAGKVKQDVDITSGGEKIKGYIGWTPEKWKADDEKE